MAKKAAKKASSKKAPAKKPAAKKAGNKTGSKAGGMPPGMKPISTGKGASAAEIGAAVVAHINSGAQSDAPLWDKHWHKDFVSIEGVGANMSWEGRKAVQAKCDDWMSKNTVHGCRAEGPFVGSTGFAVKLSMDVEEKASGKRFQMDEVAVYTVQNGKVVREEFMYGGMK
jgi:ketosteroid isomerase-like protein